MASVFYVQKPLICCQNIFDKTEILKKIEKSSQTFWNTETYPSYKPQNNGRKCDILNNKPEFLFYRPSIYRHRYHSTKKYVTKQIGLSKLNAILILSFEWKLILKAETLKLIWHNWALFWYCTASINLGSYLSVQFKLSKAGIASWDNILKQTKLIDHLFSIPIPCWNQH